jgi:membrane-associated phospholipid phosphatase
VAAHPVRLGDPVVWAPPLAALAGSLALWLLDANTTAFLMINQGATAVPDPILAGVTILGDTAVMLAILLPLYQRFPGAVWSMLLAGIIATVLVQGGKYALDLPRPPAVLPPEAFRVVGPGYHGRSFPSGHSATVFTMAGVASLYLWAHARRGLALALAGAAALVAVSRSAVGIHWPQDLLAGMALGWIAATAGVLWARRYRWGLSGPGRYGINALLVAMALWLLLFHDTGYPQARKWQQVIAVIALAAAYYGAWPAVHAGLAAARRRLGATLRRWRARWGRPGQ